MKYERTPKWDKHRPIFLKVGFIWALALALMAFNYTSYDKPSLEIYDGPPLEDIDEVIPPITRDLRKRQLPPPEPTIIEMDLSDDIPEPEFIDDVLPEQSVSDDLNTAKESFDIPLVLPRQDEQADEIIHSSKKPKEEPVLFAQEMPVYNTCDRTLGEEDRRKCTTSKMLDHIYKHLTYPAYARENGIEGTVVVSFVVGKDGNLKDATVMREIGGGCGDAVLDVLSKLGSFTPGIQNGKPVSVIYRIPVKFALEG